MLGTIAMRHTDLSVDSPNCDAVNESVCMIFWWRNLPLGVRLYSPDQLPLSWASRLQLAAQFGAEQLAARKPALGAPHQATHEGLPKLGLSLDSVRNSDGLLIQLEELAVPSSARAQDISVIICTLDRRAALKRCLASLAIQTSPPGEILIIDNSPDGNARSVCVAFPEMRYLHEPRAGLSIARNAGIRASRNNIIAFTDDDVEVDANWTAEIARTFVDGALDAMTGLILPASLGTPAQCYFQLHMGGFGAAFTPVVFGSPFFRETRRYGAQVWKIGAGANMAFRRSLFDRVGFFDERLGAGASGCSEDSELWYRLLAQGGVCLYEPRAVVYHHHRCDWRSLNAQARAYMEGHVSALIVQYDRFGDRGNMIRIWRQLPLYFIRTFVAALREGDLVRLSILFWQVIGWLEGLTYLVRWPWRRRGRTGLHPVRDDPLAP